MQITVEDIREAVRQLDLSGRGVCIHASLRSFGWVEGDAPAIVHGFLAEGCTVLVPTFLYGYLMPPLAHQRPARNGWDYDSPPIMPPGIGRVYTPDSNEIDQSDMGAVPASVLAMPGRVRGIHQLDSFTAVGPLAHTLVDGQRPLDVYAPLRALGDMGGVVILMGVGLNRMTLLHLAEQVAGRNLFRRWANGPDGVSMEVEVGGCSTGFEHLAPAIAPLEQRAEVGASTWRIYPARETVELAAAAIRDRPDITRCSRPSCERCEDAILGGPILTE
jgi:aminoglycoside N3'-acetyltransferase